MTRGTGLSWGCNEYAVRESLDLCLACKGCKSDCPAGVDIATWKAEFLSGYYRGRLRPGAAYSVGVLHPWARLAASAPGLANFVTQTPGLAGIAKAIAGIAPRRRLPRFASETFREWFGRGDRRGPGSVVLFPDTFTNHFSPRIGEAAVRVLERAGFEVALPARDACCGRPLFD